MPQLDLSDVLLDPMIAGESFVVLRRQEVVNEFGESVVSEVELPGRGSILPVGESSLLRDEAYQTQAKTIRVITKFRLRGSASDEEGNSFQPDIVVWNGDNYIVRTVDDYSQYGAGFIESECICIDYNNQVPTTQ